jgi:hypothetical protein
MHELFIQKAWIMIALFHTLAFAMGKPPVRLARSWLSSLGDGALDTAHPDHAVSCMSKHMAAAWPSRRAAGDNTSNHSESFFEVLLLSGESVSETYLGT